MIAPSARNSRNAIVARAKNARAGQASGYPETFRRFAAPERPARQRDGGEAERANRGQQAGADTPKYKNAAPTPAPARPPMLKAAWNEDMIGALHPRSTTLA